MPCHYCENNKIGPEIGPENGGQQVNVAELVDDSLIYVHDHIVEVCADCYEKHHPSPQTSTPTPWEARREERKEREQKRQRWLARQHRLEKQRQSRVDVGIVHRGKK